MAEAVAVRCGGRAVGQAQPRPHRGDPPVGDALTQPPAPHAPENRCVRRLREGAGGPIGVECLPHRRQQGHPPLPAALAAHGQRLCRTRQVAVVEAQRLAQPQPRAPEEGDQRPVAQARPVGLVGLLPFARQVDDGAGVVDRQRPRQGRLTARRGDQSDRRVVQDAPPVQEAEEAADAGQPAGPAGRSRPGAAPAGQIGRNRRVPGLRAASAPPRCPGESLTRRERRESSPSEARRVCVAAAVPHFSQRRPLRDRVQARPAGRAAGPANRASLGS